MKIITVSREFASGGRELGKRLADALEIPCYDREIIDMVAEKHGFDRNYVANVSQSDIRAFYPSTIGRRFLVPHPAEQTPLKITFAQQSIIRQLASNGECVIIGRAADIILRDFNTMNIFVYADKMSKLARCKERAPKDEKLSDKEILRNMKQIDKERSNYHAVLSDTEWGDRKSYHLCVNTSGKNIKKLTAGLAEYVRLWFEE